MSANIGKHGSQFQASEAARSSVEVSVRSVKTLFRVVCASESSI